MAEESDYSRSEPASEKRLELARAEGNIPRSAEWSALLALATMAAGLSIWGVHLFERLQQLFAQHFSQVAQLAPQSAWLLLRQSAAETFPFLIALFLAALIAPLLLSGWVFAPGIVRVHGERLDPFASLARLFSAAGFVDGIKAVVKVLALALLLFTFYRMHLDELPGLISMPLTQAVAAAASVLSAGFLLLLGAVLLVAMIDAPWQWWRHLRSLAMTRAEALAEAREEEGNPELKARLLARRQSLRQRGNE